MENYKLLFKDGKVWVINAPINDHIYNCFCSSCTELMGGCIDSRIEVKNEELPVFKDLRGGFWFWTPDHNHPLQEGEIFDLAEGMTVEIEDVYHKNFPDLRVKEIATLIPKPTVIIGGDGIPEYGNSNLNR